jgi:hypothetical protein
LAGCAPPTADNPGPTPTQRPAVELATTTPLPPDRIATTSFIDADRGWAVGEVADGGGSLVQRTTDGGRTWEVLYADGVGFPLTDVCFTDALHGWAVSSSGTLSNSLTGIPSLWPRCREPFAAVCRVDAERQSRRRSQRRQGARHGVALLEAGSSTDYDENSNPPSRKIETHALDASAS